MNQDPDRNGHMHPSIKSTRERLEEIRREREQRSTGYQIRNNPSTILSNMAIQILSTVILGVGFYYILWYLNFRREYMLARHYSMFISAMALVCVAWLVYTVIRLRTDYHRYREAVRHREEQKRKDGSDSR